MMQVEVDKWCLTEMSAAIVLATALLSGCSPATLKASTGEPSVPAVAANSAPGTESARGDEQSREPLVNALRLLQKKEFESGYAALDRLIQGPQFSRLSIRDQYHALLIAGQVGLELKHTKAAYGYTLRSSEMSEATADDWEARIDGAGQLGLKADRVHGLTVLAQRWPERLPDYYDEFIFRVADDASALADAGVRSLDLMQALYDAKWKLDRLVEPSYLWRDLTLRLLEKDNTRAAIEVSAHIKDPYDLISMRVDNRFDAVIDAHPEYFDVAAATARNQRDLQAAAEALPKKLHWRRSVAETLRQQAHYAAALAVLDSLIAEVASLRDPKSAYDDFDDEYVWVLNDRAIVLERLRRLQQAEDQFRQAGQINESGGDTNVSQRINLAETFCSWEQPAKALKMISDLRPENASPYGQMQVESIRLEAGLQLHDQKMADAALNYLSTHRKDAMSTYQAALIEADRLDEAAALLISRLADTESRREALMRIQVYVQPPEAAHDQKMAARWRSVIDRPAVRAAVSQVGRIEQYDLEDRLH